MEGDSVTICVALFLDSTGGPLGAILLGALSGYAIGPARCKRRRKVTKNRIRARNKKDHWPQPRNRAFFRSQRCARVGVSIAAYTVWRGTWREAHINCTRDPLVIVTTLQILNRALPVCATLQPVITHILNNLTMWGGHSRTSQPVARSSEIAKCACSTVMLFNHTLGKCSFFCERHCPTHLKARGGHPACIASPTTIHALARKAPCVNSTHANS